MPDTTALRAVDNRRSMCAHCSLRTDLPGFIDFEHASGNAQAIASGELFKCHMVHDPTQEAAPNRACLGAALVAKVPLGNSPAGGGPEVYADLATYINTQAGGRKDNRWLDKHADKWYDRNRTLWFGWWAQAPAGNWHYLLTTLAGNRNNSVYLFFDQLEDLYGPLELHRG